MVTAGTGTATVNSNHQPGDLFGVGLQSVIYEAIDSGGLMDSCSFEVSITGILKFMVVVVELIGGWIGDGDGGVTEDGDMDGWGGDEGIIYITFAVCYFLHLFLLGLVF